MASSYELLFSPGSDVECRKGAGLFCFMIRPHPIHTHFVFIKLLLWPLPVLLTLRLRDKLHTTPTRTVRRWPTPPPIKFGVFTPFLSCSHAFSGVFVSELEDNCFGSSERANRSFSCQPFPVPLIAAPWLRHNCSPTPTPTGAVSEETAKRP